MIILALCSTTILFLGISTFLFGQTVYLNWRNDSLANCNRELTARNEELQARMNAAGAMVRVTADELDRIAASRVEVEEEWPSEIEWQM